jgi:hypothetical protein
VTFAESEGDKKLANLPYTFLLKAGAKAGDGGPNSPWSKLRVGSRASRRRETTILWNTGVLTVMESRNRRTIFWLE